jgi:hypothetical protein
MRRFSIAVLGLCAVLCLANVSNAQVRDPIARKTNPELGFFEPKKSSSSQVTNNSSRTTQPTKTKWFFKRIFR